LFLILMVTLLTTSPWTNLQAQDTAPGNQTASPAETAKAAPSETPASTSAGLPLWAKILIGVSVAILLFLVYVAMQSSDFRVKRSISINASPEAVFPHVNHLRKWEPWNPWGKLDPNMKLTYEGPAEGVGASYSWSGNGNVGEGRNTIIESHLHSLVRFKLEFFKPFAGVNQTDFTFTPDGRQTVVMWDMTGKLNFTTKIFHVLMNMDKMIGGQFEKGLQDMKTVVEAQRP
jgi:hypothetical protein